MGIAVHDAFGVTDLHGLKHLQGLRAGGGAGRAGVQAIGLDDLLAHGHHRVQAELGVLHDHADAPAANGAHLSVGQVQDGLALQLHPGGLDPAGRAHQAQDRAAGHGLARPALAHDAKAFAAQVEIDAAHGLEFALPGREGDAQVAHGQKGFGHDLSPLGSSTSRSPSPSRLKAIDTRKIAMPGMAATHQKSRI